MNNLVPCKSCGVGFVYTPGFSGNARQLCDECRIEEDNEELFKLEEATIKEGNRYLLDAPKRKSEYDPVEILVEGNMPKLDSDADRFVCAVEIGSFLRNQNGFCGMEENVAKLLEHLGPIHAVLCIKGWTLKMMEMACKNKHTGPLTKKYTSILNEWWRKK